MKLANKVALITGGTSGIGLETAKLFVAEGAQVVITGANGKRLDAAARDIGGGILALRIRRSYEHLDILFANAGVGFAGPLEAVTEQDIDVQLAVNFKGAFFALQKAAPLLAKGGSVVLTTSFLDAVG